MPVCGQFHVRRALEIRGKFTSAAMHIQGPVRVKTRNPQREQNLSAVPRKPTFGHHER
jgi:hypothetical protein